MRSKASDVIPALLLRMLVLDVLLESPLLLNLLTATCSCLSLSLMNSSRVSILASALLSSLNRADPLREPDIPWSNQLYTAITECTSVEDGVAP
jgi:hypothetical protein